MPETDGVGYYDGFYILPSTEERQIKLTFFELKDEHRGEPVGGTDIGEQFHVALLSKTEKGVFLDDNFEAILRDPVVYAKNLIGLDLYGCILRKTTKSAEWIEQYLQLVLKRVMIEKLKQYAESINDD